MTTHPGRDNSKNNLGETNGKCRNVSVVINLPARGPLGIGLRHSEGCCTVHQVADNYTGDFRAGDVITYFNGRPMGLDANGRPLKKGEELAYWTKLFSSRPPTATNFVRVIRLSRIPTTPTPKISNPSSTPPNISKKRKAVDPISNSSNEPSMVAKTNEKPSNIEVTVRIPARGPLNISISADKDGYCTVYRVHKPQNSDYFRVGDVITSFNGRSMLMDATGHPLIRTGRLEYWTNLFSSRPPTNTNYVTVLRKSTICTPTLSSKPTNSLKKKKTTDSRIIIDEPTNLTSEPPSVSEKRKTVDPISSTCCIASTIRLPARGPLGIEISPDKDGFCTVDRVLKPHSSRFMVGQIIIEFNGRPVNIDKHGRPLIKGRELKYWKRLFSSRPPTNTNCVKVVSPLNTLTKKKTTDSRIISDEPRKTAKKNGKPHEVEVTVRLPARGPLGISLCSESDGCCTVERVSNPRIDDYFRVGDVIMSLNGKLVQEDAYGRHLKEEDELFDHWMKIFSSRSHTDTNVVTILRSSSTAALSSEPPNVSKEREAIDSDSDSESLKSVLTNVAAISPQPPNVSKERETIDSNFESLNPVLTNVYTNSMQRTNTISPNTTAALITPHKNTPPNQKVKKNFLKPPPAHTVTVNGSNGSNNSNGKKEKPSKKKTNKSSKYVQLPVVPLTVYPLPGTICQRSAHYSTLKNETYDIVSRKLGLDNWRDLAFIQENVKLYGPYVRASTLFKEDTLLRIPTAKCSKWNLSKLTDTKLDKIEELGICLTCSKRELPDDPNPMMICDGCDATQHLSCSGLLSVPGGAWFCQTCEDVLKARREFYQDMTARTLQAQLPPLPKLPPVVRATALEAKSKLLAYLTERKEREIEELRQSQSIIARELKDRIARFELFDIPSFTLAERTHRQNSKNEEERRRQERFVYNRNNSNSTAENNPDDLNRGMLRFKDQSYHAQRTWESARDELILAKQELVESKREQKGMILSDEGEHQQLLLDYAILMDEPKLLFERKKQYDDRPSPPSFLGVCVLENELDAQVLNILHEPTELILAIPMSRESSNHSSNTGDDSHTSTTTSAQCLVVGVEYAIFGCAALFEAERDDNLPMDLSGNGSFRVAQKRLVSMLLRNGQPLQVTGPSVPSSVRLRGDENLQHVSKCFDLSELVRDCNCPLDMPKAYTPKRLMEHGLVLRDYQQLSLQWMLDKERNTTGMGFAKELWSRMQCLDGSGQYFYCKTTGSLIKDIFDFKSDAEQTDASKHFGSLPAGGILGDEMGLGKTVISLALICANPPPQHNQVLPREHVSKFDHPLYTKPPSVVGCTSSSAKNIFLSNGTVVISPMTLQSQWFEEIKRFAPWMSVLTLHNDENPTVEEIASKDVVVISTFLLQQKSGRLLNMLKRIHFHRCLLDESHYNQSGTRVKQSLASLSSTFRFCVTGTPIGRSLDDLQGQLRFLRVPQFCRSGFWKQNIGSPYCERNYDALRVLRSLLSRVVIRHSKEQTDESGSAMLSLPPRTVETILLPFGSEAEERLYNQLENRNLKRFMDLRSQSPKTVLAKFMELNGMIYSARKACAHAELINLDSIQNCNANLADEKRYKEGKSRPKVLSRAEVLEQAVENARPSAKNRMREAILMFHHGKIDCMECPVCLEPTRECDIALTPCAHKFCAECIVNVLDGASSTREAKGHCPQCRDVVRRSELTFLADALEAGEKKIASKEKVEEEMSSAISFVSAQVNGFQLNSKDVLSAATGSSTPRFNCKYLTEVEKRKQRAACHAITPEFLADHEIASSCLGTKTSRLLEEIKKMFDKDPESKCVVFSQFLGALDIASKELKARGISFVRIDGNMKQYQRADALLDFSDNPNTRVFFLSMRAGAAGLNLIAADHCFILDAPMNSAIEEQAIDRIHRIGQNRPVVVKRFIIKDSIEERILSNRRSLVADHPARAVSTQIDGAGMMTEELELLESARNRPRLDNETNVDASSFQRLKFLEGLFGCSATARVFQA